MKRSLEGSRFIWVATYFACIIDPNEYEEEKLEQNVHISSQQPGISKNTIDLYE